MPLISLYKKWFSLDNQFEAIHRTLKKELDQEISKLKADLEEERLSLQKKIEELERIKKQRPSIEKLIVEHIHIDKYETNNYIGSLGVKELKGTLNIGANYGEASEEVKEEVMDQLEKKIEEKVQEKVEEKLAEEPKEERVGTKPKINIKSRDGSHLGKRA
ncbi:hypothetical protein MO973_05365 [Paenibacillus sp. TRM 82003]|nr:hypothetical protein [Paenibacillus sp. TRM 82003]